MQQICNYDNCVACGLCKSICPMMAIDIKKDCYGILKPTIQQDKCIDCGLCKMKCVVNKQVLLHYPCGCYATVDKNYNRVVNSASGGVGYILYHTFLTNNKNAVVYGVALNNQMRPEFRECNSLEEIDIFRGSIYAQADIFKVYKNIEVNLTQGRNVLVIALPCQLAGLMRYLEVKHIKVDNLYLVDMLCHGVVPEEYFLQEIKEMQNRKNHGKIISVRFRSNKKNENYYIRYEYEDGFIVKRKAECDYYFNGFISNITLQDSCFNCQFSQPNRVGDLTIGDFIGLDRTSIASSMKKRNVSVVMVNTEKGERIFETCFSDLILEERPIEEGLKGPSFNGGASNPGAVRNKFRNDCVKIGYHKSIRKHTKKKIIKNRFMFGIKKTIKFLLGKK